MLKKEITYENPFTEMKVTETFWFHISKAELVRMEVEEHKETFIAPDGTEYSGMQAKLQRIVHAEDGKAMMPVFEDIIRRSFGRRDGDRFIRTDEIWEDFKSSGAFDELLFQLCTDAEASAEFVRGAMPGTLEELAQQVRAEVAAQEAAKKPTAKKRAAKKKTDQPELESDEDRAAIIAAASVDNPVELRQNELATLEPEDLQTGLASGKFTLAPPTGHTAV